MLRSQARRAPATGLAALPPLAWQPLRLRHPPLPAPNPPPSSFLAELEMRLHLAGEDTALYLGDHAARAQLRIPAAARELLRIQVRGRGTGRRAGGMRAGRPTMCRRCRPAVACPAAV